MADDPETLEDADPDGVLISITHALQYDGRKHCREAAGIDARILAERLLEHLMQSGYVIKQRPPEANGTHGHKPPGTPVKEQAGLGSAGTGQPPNPLDTDIGTEAGADTRI